MSYLRASSAEPIVMTDLRPKVVECLIDGKAVRCPIGFMNRHCTPMSHQQEILRKMSRKIWMSVYIFRYLNLLMLSHFDTQASATRSV